MGSMGFQNVIYTPEVRDQLRIAYDIAVENNADTFYFQGHAYLTEYARYLLQFLDERFGGATEQGEH